MHMSEEFFFFHGLILSLRLDLLNTFWKELIKYINIQNICLKYKHVNTPQ